MAEPATYRHFGARYKTWALVVWQYSPGDAIDLGGSDVHPHLLSRVHGIILFIGQENTGWFDAPFALQRSLILASWLVAATGAVLLAGVRPSDRASALLVAGVEFFVVGALIGTREFTVTSVIGVVFASSLFVGEALIGAGLLRSGLVSTWVAWTVMVWNLLWLVTLLVISREDMYYPGLHYIPLLLIGIPLVDRRRRESLRQIPEDR